MPSGASGFVALRKIEVAHNLEFVVGPRGKRLLDDLRDIVLVGNARGLLGRKLAAIEAKVLKRRLPKRIVIRRYAPEASWALTYAPFRQACL